MPKKQQHVAVSVFQKWYLIT